MRHDVRRLTWKSLDLLIPEREIPFALNILVNDEYEVESIAGSGHTVSRILDIGANIGAFAIKCLDLFPQALVTCIEPAPDCFEILQANLKPYEARVQLIESAVGPCSGYSVLAEMPDGTTTGRYLDANPRAGWMTDKSPLGHRVRVQTMSQLMKDMPEEIDIIKVDAEMAEYVVFQQLAELSMLSRFHWIRGEWHDRARIQDLRCLLDTTHVMAFADTGHLVGLFVGHRRISSSSP